MGRNERKRAVLGFLASRTRPASVQDIAWGVRLTYHRRGLYSHLARYARWGLVLRAPGLDGRAAWRLGPRGRARLAWLRRQGAHARH
jgi:hypothetical protein